MVVLVVVLVVVVLETSIVELVVVVAQARQQLPVSAAPPAVSHRVGERLMRHRSPPSPIGCQHAASPGRPQVDRVAHLTTALLHAFGRVLPRASSFAIRLTHWT